MTSGGELNKEFTEELKEKLSVAGKKAWAEGKHDDNAKLSDEVLQRRKENAKGGVYFKNVRQLYCVTIPASWTCEKKQTQIGSFKNEEEALELLEKCKQKVEQDELISRSTFGIQKTYVMNETRKKILSAKQKPTGSVYKQGNNYYPQIPKHWSTIGKRQRLPTCKTEQEAWDLISKWKVEHNIV